MDVSSKKIERTFTKVGTERPLSHCSHLNETAFKEAHVEAVSLVLGQKAKDMLQGAEPGPSEGLQGLGAQEELQGAEERGQASKEEGL